MIEKIYYLNRKLRSECFYSLDGNIINGKCYDIDGKVEFEIKDDKGKAKIYYYNRELLMENI